MRPYVQEQRLLHPAPSFSPVPWMDDDNAQREKKHHLEMLENHQNLRLVGIHVILKPLTFIQFYASSLLWWSLCLTRTYTLEIHISNNSTSSKALVIRTNIGNILIDLQLFSSIDESRQSAIVSSGSVIHTRLSTPVNPSTAAKSVAPVSPFPPMLVSPPPRRTRELSLRTNHAPRSVGILSGPQFPQ